MENPADNIILIGMPGVGKSTVGVLLAKRLGFAFLDTDLLIQTSENMRLQVLIQQHGVEGFKNLEAVYLQNVTTRQTVIATGGSAIYRENAMAHLNKLGRIIYLEIALEPLMKRLERLDERGVVFIPGQTFESLYAERQPLYRNYGQIIMSTNGMTPEQVVRGILSALAQDPLWNNLE